MYVWDYLYICMCNKIFIIIMIIKIKIKCLLKESPSFCCILVHRRHRSCNFVSSVCPILGEPKRSPKQR